MKKIIGFIAVALFAGAAQAADIEAGKTKVATVCAACHGPNGVSVSDTIPNLAAQRAGYHANARMRDTLRVIVIFECVRRYRIEMARQRR